MMECRVAVRVLTVCCSAHLEEKGDELTVLGIGHLVMVLCVHVRVGVRGVKDI